MKKAAVYIHGQGGSPAEAEHYKALLPDRTMIGFDYQSHQPWEATEEFPPFFASLQQEYDSIIVIAGSLGAYFAMLSLADAKIDRAYFISPIVDMERLIADMMLWAGVSEDRLRREQVIENPFGDPLSWEYLSWVRANPIRWQIPTAILYGSADNLQSCETMLSFAEAIGADLTVLEGGEHWFHTQQQMAFLDDWLTKSEPAALTVRFARPEDLPRVNELRAMVNQLHVSGRPDLFQPGFGPQLREYLFEMYEKYDILLVCLDGVIAGFAVGENVHRPSNPYNLERSYYHIHEFGVDAAFRRRGAATALMQACRSRAKELGLKKLDLNVWEFNRTALAFYEASGFRTSRRYMEQDIE